MKMENLFILKALEWLFETLENFIGDWPSIGKGFIYLIIILIFLYFSYLIVFINFPIRFLIFIGILLVCELANWIGGGHSE